MKPLFFAELGEIFQTNLSNGPHKHKKGKGVKKYKRLFTRREKSTTGVTTALTVCLVNCRCSDMQLQIYMNIPEHLRVSMSFLL